jgi:hypothetical protein
MALPEQLVQEADIASHGETHEIRCHLCGSTCTVVKSGGGQTCNTCMSKLAQEFWTTMK